MAPFNRPNVIESMIENPAAWSTYIQDSDDVPNPVLPMTFAPVEDAKQLKKRNKSGSKYTSKASSPSKGKHITPTPSEPAVVDID